MEDERKEVAYKNHHEKKINRLWGEGTLLRERKEGVFLKSPLLHQRLNQSKEYKKKKERSKR